MSRTLLDDGVSLPLSEFPNLRMTVEWWSHFSSTGKIHPLNPSAVVPALVSAL